MTEAHEIGASVGAWNALVRRARIGRDRKAAALVMSSYARANGTGIHCGVARLAVDLECSHRTARRYLAWLRDVGLVELVREGNRRRGHSDEYRLVTRPEILTQLDVPDPGAYKAMCETVGEANQGTSLVTPDDQGPAYEDQGSPMVSHDDVDQGSNGPGSGVTLGDPPSSINTSQGRSTSQADDEELRTDVAVGRPVVVEIFPGASQEARYRPPPPGSRFRDAGRAELAAKAAQARDAVAAIDARRRARKELS